MATDTIKAIQTRYKGYHFRSRTEARVAVLLDSLGVRWGYEVEGYLLSNGVRYLPDFYLSDWDCHLEVKGAMPTFEEVEKCYLLGMARGRPCFLLHGDLFVPEFSNDSKGVYIIDPRDGVCVTCASPVVDGKCIGKKGKTDCLCAPFLYGFYESPSGGAVQLDHLYVEDVIAGPAGWSDAIKLTSGGPAIPCRNFGAGRTFRSNRIREAFAAARSARFEFGESGRT